MIIKMVTTSFQAIECLDRVAFGYKDLYEMPFKMYFMFEH